MFPARLGALRDPRTPETDKEGLARAFCEMPLCCLDELCSGRLRKFMQVG